MWVVSFDIKKCKFCEIIKKQLLIYFMIKINYTIFQTQTAYKKNYPTDLYKI